MALIDEIDGLIFNSFQQNFLSNYADQIAGGGITYSGPANLQNEPSDTAFAKESAPVFPPRPNINSPSNTFEASKSKHILPFQDSFNSPSNRANTEKVHTTYPASPGEPPKNLGVVTSPWPPQNNPTQVWHKPKHLPVGSDTYYGPSAGTNMYDGGPMSVVKGGPFSTPGLPAALKPIDAFATAHWLRNIGKELFGRNGEVNLKDDISVGNSKGFQFVSSQILLAALNPKDPELGGGTIPGGILNAAWNPASLIASSLPFARPSNLTSVTLGPVFDATFDPTTSRIDKYIAQIHKEEKATAQIGPPEDVLAKTKIPKFLPSLFAKVSGFDRIKNTVSVMPSIDHRPHDTPENLNARISENDVDGVNDFKDQPQDDQLYMPLVFQDLRDGDRNKGQFLYFRAFIKSDSVTETFTPTWNVSQYYGRIDNVPTYMNTSRIIGFSFDIVAWQPADLPVIYRKLHKLQSMVYPFFDQQGFLSAGPIIRMRIGDLFSTANYGKLGLPGYLTSLDVAYDSVWNIEKDFKIPRKATISISFTALHEGNPGTYQVNPNGDNYSTFGTGKFVANNEADPNEGGVYQGHEIGIRGLLKNIESSRSSRTAPGAEHRAKKVPGTERHQR